MSLIKSVERLKKKVGNEKIVEIKVGRTPLSKIMLFFLNITSLGEFQKRLKETEYDKLYHLFMIIKTEKGSYILEKNEVIILKKFNGKITKNTEILETNLRENLTINILLDKTKAFMGDKFYVYKGQDNNCQFFLQSILKANSLITDEIDKFVLQNTSVLFENNPNFRKIVNSLTDIGGYGRQIVDKPLSDIDVIKEEIGDVKHEMFRPAGLLKLGFQNPFI